LETNTEYYYIKRFGLNLIFGRRNLSLMARLLAITDLERQGKWPEVIVAPYLTFILTDIHQLIIPPAMEGYKNVFACPDVVSWQQFEGRRLAGLLASAAAVNAENQSFSVKVC
jgi:hypothetical protein